MRASLKFALTAFTVIAPVLLLVIGCNKATQDPSSSENQITVVAVTPNTACVDVDGTILQNGSGNQVVYYDTVQKLTFQSIVRGNSTTQGSAWNNVTFDSIDISYAMNDGGPVPPPWVDKPGPITVPANGTTDASLVTVPVADIGPGTAFDTAGRVGSIFMVFRGKDAANQPAQTSVRIPLGTYTACQQGQ